MQSVATIHPQSLDELLRLSADELARCDIARMNLLCATGLPGAESVDVDEYLERLDSWAKHIAAMTEGNLDSFRQNSAMFDNSEPLWRMLAMTRMLEREYHIHYHANHIDQEPDWRDSTGLLLHGLLGPQRHGTCPSLPVLVVAVGRRLSYPLRLVATTGHLFSRWDGLDHSRQTWREKRNIEFRGDGMNSHPDEFYLTWPVAWSPELHALEQRRGTKRLFLRSFLPAEELAHFLAQRGHCLEAHGRVDEALATYQQAWNVAPHNDIYRFYADTLRRTRTTSLRPEVQAINDQVTASIRNQRAAANVGIVDEVFGQWASFRTSLSGQSAIK